MTAYQEIATAIRADIEARHLVEGDRLPTVREMAERYGAPTGTVAKAVDMPPGGWSHRRRARPRPIRARASAGSCARHPAVSHGHRGQNGKAIQDHDTNGRLRVVDVTVDEVHAPEDVAQAFAVPAQAVLSRARRFAVEDRIVQFATSFIPLAVVAAAPAVAYTGPGPGGIYARMTRGGNRPGDVPRDGDLPDADMAEAAKLTSAGRYAGHRHHPARVHRSRPVRRGQRDGAGLQRLRAGIRLHRLKPLADNEKNECEAGSSGSRGRR